MVQLRPSAQEGRFSADPRLRAAVALPVASPTAAARQADEAGAGSGCVSLLNRN